MWLDEVELKTVTISNVSIDSKLVETDGEVGTENSPLIPVQENQL